MSRFYGSLCTIHCTTENTEVLN